MKNSKQNSHQHLQWPWNAQENRKGFFFLKKEGYFAEFLYNLKLYILIFIKFEINSNYSEIVSNLLLLEFTKTIKIYKKKK